MTQPDKSAVFKSDYWHLTTGYCAVDKQYENLCLFRNLLHYFKHHKMHTYEHTCTTPLKRRPDIIDHQVYVFYKPRDVAVVSHHYTHSWDKSCVEVTITGNSMAKIVNGLIHKYPSLTARMAPAISNLPRLFDE